MWAGEYFKPDGKEWGNFQLLSFAEYVTLEEISVILEVMEGDITGTSRRS
jgi:hypothetical protein